MGNRDLTADLNINGGTLDVSGGTLNVSDAMDIVTGTVTQSGGTPILEITIVQVIQENINLKWLQERLT